MRANYRSRRLLLSGEAAYGSPTSRPAPFQERPSGSFPMVFTTQYRARDPEEEGRKVTDEVSSRLRLLFNEEGPVYADVRVCRFENPVECPAVWISILADFPARVPASDVQDLKDYFFGSYSELYSARWTESVPLDLRSPSSRSSSDGEAICSFRFDWFW
ncbi:hypothetical protein BDW69DRAFT_157053 [Aspergillus filifer]